MKQTKGRFKLIWKISVDDWVFFIDDWVFVVCICIYLCVHVPISMLVCFYLLCVYIVVIVYLLCVYIVVIARCQVQYGKCFPSLSYFASYFTSYYLLLYPIERAQHVMTLSFQTFLAFIKFFRSSVLQSMPSASFSINVLLGMPGVLKTCKGC